MHQPGLINSISSVKALQRLLLCSLLCLTIAPVCRAQEQRLEYDLDPYSVKIEIVFADQPSLTPQIRKQVVDEAERLNYRTYGRMWNRTVKENQTLLPRHPDLLERMTNERMKAIYASDELDKVFLCSVARNGLRFTVAVREWDATLESFSLIEQEEVLTIEEVPVQMNNLVVRTFRPIAKIRKMDRMENKVQFLLRAGEYPAPDEKAAQVVLGDVFLPAMRFLDKNNKVQRIRTFDWNYLLVEKIERGRIDCAVISGAATPLGSRGMRRVEQYGMRVRPLRNSTQIRLCKFNQPEIPLVAHQVLAFMKNSYREESTEEPTSYLSDRRGMIDVQLRPDHPVQWIYINSGSALLGRVPVVPGIEEFISCPLPDDSTRLEVEGMIEQLKGRIVEIVALRSSIMAEVRVAVNRGKWEDVDELLPRLDELPTAEELRSELNTITILPQNEAKRIGNPVGARRIQQLADKTAPFIDKYINTKVIDEFKEDIAAQRASAKAKEEAEADK